MERILLIGPYGLGNVLMALPAVQALRETGRYRLELACLLSSTERMCRDVPALGGLFERVHALHAGHGLTALARTAWRLRRERFDYSVVMFPSAKAHYNLASLTLGARVRIGSAFPRQPWWHLNRLNHRRVPVRPELHDCVQNVRLVAAGLGINLPDPTSYVFRRANQDARLVGVHPGCKLEYRFKRWGVARFTEAIRLLGDAHARLRFRVFFGPDERDEREQFERLLAAPPYAALADRIERSVGAPLARLLDELGECGAMISNDSGMMHMAAAQGVRTLGIFGPSDERRTGPFSPQSAVLATDIACRPCALTNDVRARAFHCIHDRQYCLTEIGPEHVLAWFDGAASGRPIPARGPT